MKMAVVGFGYWGRNVARALRENGCIVSAVHDIAGTAIGRAAHAGYAYAPTLDVALCECDAVAVCSPPDTHERIVAAVIGAGKHVWCEKPISDDPARSADMVARAHAAGLRIFVDHTFTFAPAVDVLAHEVPRFASYVECARTHRCSPRVGSSVISDLLPHDASILLKCGVGVRRARASEWSASARVDLDLSADGHAGVYLSWESPLKQRRMTFYGEECTVVYDALDPREPVRVHGGTASGDQAAFAQVAARSPAVSSDEPLALAVAAFRQAIVGRGSDNADAALRVERVVWAARESARTTGEWVTVPT